MKISLLIALLLTGLSFCEEQKSDTCAEEIILKIKAEPVRNPPAEIWLHEIDNKRYYYVTPYCCDMFSDLYDDECTLVCHPDGGISGGGDGNCGELKQKLTHGKLLWKDIRK